MKLTHAMAITIVLGFFAFGAHSEEYRAPHLKFNSVHKAQDYSATTEKNFREFKENSYRVKNSNQSNRNVASEAKPTPIAEEEGRNPSSKEKKAIEEPEFKLKSWNYNK